MLPRYPFGPARFWLLWALCAILLSACVKGDYSGPPHSPSLLSLEEEEAPPALLVPNPDGESLPASPSPSYPTAEGSLSPTVEERGTAGIAAAPGTVVSLAAERVAALRALLPPKLPGQRTIVLDPGHGADEVGAAARYGDGSVLQEKELNLIIALRLRDLLVADGFRVILTREGDSRAMNAIIPNTLGFRSTRADLRTRVDLANAAEADLFLSLHSNGASSPAQAGVEVWYCAEHPLADANWRLGNLVLESLREALAEVGYQAPARGVKPDENWRVFQGRSVHLYLLGPLASISGKDHELGMPAVLGEALFLSNPQEAELLRQPRVQEALAQGYRRAILRYLVGGL